jgi:hypothetical protein
MQRLNTAEHPFNVASAALDIAQVEIAGHG